MKDILSQFDIELQKKDEGNKSVLYTIIGGVATLLFICLFAFYADSFIDKRERSVCI